MDQNPYQAPAADCDTARSSDNDHWRAAVPIVIIYFGLQLVPYIVLEAIFNLLP